MRPLTTDMGDLARRPYFFWDEDVSVGELRSILRGPDAHDPTRLRLLGKMLREARDIDVWCFVTPLEVARALPDVGRRLGRRRGFWEFLIGGWREDGFYLHHRPTDDLDLFTDRSDAFERGRHTIGDVAASLGSTVEVRMDSPDFKRYALARGSDLVVVDLVHDRVPQLVPAKPEIDGIRVDAIDEILANKLTTLVSRQEERDLVDVYFLEQAGHRVESALAAALAKDGGCTPANLAWLLSSFPIPEGLALPGGLTTEGLRAYADALVKRLRAAALPR